MRLFLAVICLTLWAAPLVVRDRPPRPKVDTSVKMIRWRGDTTKSRAEDSLAIRQAVLEHVADPNGKYAKIDSLRIVADTAWARLIDRREVYVVDTVSYADVIIIDQHARPRGIRLERRQGRWVVESPPPSHYAGDSAAAAAAPVAAQSPRDTAAIRAAAADSGERAAVERIVADTAWALVFDPRKAIDIPGSNGTTAGTAIAVKKVRLERRSGKWVAVKPTKPKP